MKHEQHLLYALKQGVVRDADLGVADISGADISGADLGVADLGVIKYAEHIPFLKSSHGVRNVIHPSRTHSRVYCYERRSYYISQSWSRATTTS
jgi:hypothetical protein